MNKIVSLSSVLVARLTFLVVLPHQFSFCSSLSGGGIHKEKSVRRMVYTHTHTQCLLCYRCFDQVIMSSHGFDCLGITRKRTDESSRTTQEGKRTIFFMNYDVII